MLVVGDSLTPLTTAELQQQQFRFWFEFMDLGAGQYL